MKKIALRHLVLLAVIVLLYGCERVTDETASDNPLPPAVPPGFIVFTATDGRVTLRWGISNETDLSGYNLYRSDNDTNHFYRIAVITGQNYYADDSLDYNTVYYYKLTAVNGRQQQSEPTAILSASPVNRYAPGTPLYPEAYGHNWDGKKTFLIKWAQNTDGDLYCYRIYRGETPDFSPSGSNLAGTVFSNQFTDSAFQFQFYKTYYYKIVAVDNGNLSSNPCSPVSDHLLESPTVIYPLNNSQLSYVSYISFPAIKEGCYYKIVIQNNPYVGEIWNSFLYGEPEANILTVDFDAFYLDKGDYYWRIITYTKMGGEPNSVSPTYKFTIQ
jgi:hypothetical protein